MMSSRLRGRLTLGALGIVCLPCGAALGQSVQVFEDEGVYFYQVDFTWQYSTTLNSNTAEVVVDVAELWSATGIDSGYLNVETTLGWVVQNLPVLSEFPYPTIATSFRLSDDSDPGVISSLDAFVEFSAAPVETFVGGIPVSFAVDPSEFNAEGLEPALDVPAVPPVPGVVAFALGGAIEAHFQPGHSNVQAAHMQCGPAAAANSLEWLWATYGTAVPHANIPGLGCLGGGPDASLVGHLDFHMGRWCASRLFGGGVTEHTFLDGKLSYLDATGINLLVKHQDSGFVGLPGGGNFTAHGLLSFGMGNAPSAEFLIEEVSLGEDVELAYRWAKGGHFVVIVGAGRILGVPWIAYRSDHTQSNTDAVLPPDAIDNNEGTGLTDFSFLVDVGVPPDGLLDLVNERGVPRAVIAVSESPRGDEATVACDGAESGGTGTTSCPAGDPRRYAYPVNAGAAAVTAVYIGTGDCNAANYANVCTPPGWAFDVVAVPFAGVEAPFDDTVKTSHGQRTDRIPQGECPCVAAFTQGGGAPIAAGSAFTFGFDHPYGSHDVGWQVNLESDPGWNIEEWGEPCGIGVGQVHGPNASPIPAVSEWGLVVMALLGLTAGTITYRRR